ncbi:ATP-binding cassette domain-containing protein [Rufibacter roseus]|uniref:ATP-binding cassette domain-containing protein n=1 Tax=Rufibacter roseus TaxID=1567108 RepID=A0ABW2DPK4_9BACT|nr:ATP-binding cassette domain-containing protein [Rufibacter roseus]
MPPFLSLRNVSARYANHTVLSQLNWQVQKGEQWAVVGESGSGKSSLLKAIAGQIGLAQGQIDYGFYQEYLTEYPEQDAFFSFRDLVAEVGQRHAFKNFSSNSSSFYYQQRYHATDSEDAPMVGHYLAEISSSSSHDSVWSVQKVVSMFKLEALLKKQLIKLSNGETKRLLLASALLKNPKLLLLDQPLTGLDTQTRSDFDQLITQIVNSGITVIMATSHFEIPTSVTHVATLTSGRITATSTKEALDPVKAVASPVFPDVAELKRLLTVHGQKSYTTVLHLKNVSVEYGEKQILQNINWKVRQGERWALLGPNGAGKTTLLSLLNGDNPQAFSKDITLFDRKRGSGETIWDIKKKIGFVSPELFQFFPYQNNCLQVVESGLYDTLGLIKTSYSENVELAMRWLKLLSLEELAEKPLRQVSASAQRICLLARALIKNPPLLILDEPCQGMDAPQQHRFKLLLEAICAYSNTSLIYVSHYPQEIPACVTKVLQLQNGVVQEHV